jgi:WD40 repeat protein
MVHEGRVNAVTLSLDGAYVATASDDKTARVWKVSSGEEVAHLAHNTSVNAVAFSPDGAYVATASKDKIARVWKVADGRGVARITHEDSINAIIFSSNGKFLLTVGKDQILHISLWQQGDLITAACDSLKRNVPLRMLNFTDEEWHQYFLDESSLRSAQPRPLRLPGKRNNLQRRMLNMNRCRSSEVKN